MNKDVAILGEATTCFVQITRVRPRSVLAHQDEFGNFVAKRMCRALGLEKSGYYQLCIHVINDRAKLSAELTLSY